MAQLTLKVRKVKTIHPKTKAEGLSARVVTNGKASFEDICELAGLNTTAELADIQNRWLRRFDIDGKIGWINQYEYAVDEDKGIGEVTFDFFAV